MGCWRLPDMSGPVCGRSWGRVLFGICSITERRFLRMRLTGWQPPAWRRAAGSQMCTMWILTRGSCPPSGLSSVGYPTGSRMCLPLSGMRTAAAVTTGTCGKPGLRKSWRASRLPRQVISPQGIFLWRRRSAKWMDSG